ncbi:MULTISPECIES: type I pullulanase [Neobacillus]|jgi:pullulanase|nr:type I pullulanase [Neobacillus sedimentimangrovi]AIM15928.1 pullulanase [Bacillus sp. X1(2014)]
MISTERLFFAYLDEMATITILMPLSYHHGLSSSFTITQGSLKSPLTIVNRVQIENYQKYTCKLNEEFCFGTQYWVLDEHGGQTDLQIGAIIRTEEFDKKFYYEGNDLGVIYSTIESGFKLWAPTATQVKLKLRNPKTKYSEIIKMKREDVGVWSVVVRKNLEYYHYSYLVQVNQEWREVVDPYVKAVSANGDMGVIVDLNKTRREKPVLPPLENPVDAIIYETHIRDFTIHPNSGVGHKGLYLGVAERGTRSANGELTGLSYVKDLGVTHIEFLPFNDFAGVDELNPLSKYNWGYNPIHFNAPEGSYSTDPSDPYARIHELKEMIHQIHEAGLRVIMDVVYNHVYIREESSFEKILPGYYFRHNEMGLPSNGTGVGNDIASERRMVRKFIVDSVEFWLKEYHVDGFRFDLMGILDVETMNEVRKVCDRLGNDILIIGEGWNLNTPLPLQKKANIANQAKLPSIGQFNDQFRDSIKGSTFNLHDKGYAFGNKHYFEAAVEAIMGSVGFHKRSKRIFNEPFQSVNYIECHDNHTLWDKIEACLPNVDEEIRMKIHRLATGIVLLSQGIPFLHSGQEFLRTKEGDSNSYQSPDSINQLDWDRKSKYKENVNYIKGLIQIRKAYSCFRMRKTVDIQNRIRLLPLVEPLLGALYLGEQEEMILLINPTANHHFISIPKGEWLVLADSDQASTVPTRMVQGGGIQMEPISLNVLLKK